MLLDDRLLRQEWVQELTNADFRMLIYLFSSATKSGIVELNMRMLNFAANTGHSYTQEEVVKKFAGLLRPIPNNPNTVIFPDWIRRNWTKGRCTIDCERNPLYKSISNELALFGLTIEDVAAMNGECIEAQVSHDTSSEQVVKEDGTEVKVDYGAMFESFWKSWPSKCPRKTDKKKCRDKLIGILKNARKGEAETMFATIMAGLETWKRSEQWNRDEGQFIMAPLRWLNGENWKDEVATSDNGRKAESEEIAKTLTDKLEF